ncbi:hypothetical protein Peur_001538 [Populus x canadensis]
MGSCYSRGCVAVPFHTLVVLFPVNLDVKDGSIVGRHRSDHVTSPPLETKHVSLAASATSPRAQVPEDLTPSNEIEALPVSNESFLLYENGEDFVKTMHRADHG